LKYKLTICDEINPSHQWDEIYTEDDVTDPEARGKEMIADYNEGIPRHGGERRKFIRAEIIDLNAKSTDHDWKKMSPVTVIKGNKTYDVYQCSKCGITGKRYGLNTTVKRDPKFKAPKYEKCQ